MPELPEVETTKTSLNPLLGQTVSQVRLYQPKLRWPIPGNIDDLEGYTLTSVARRAKYLILTFSKSSNNNDHTIALQADSKPSFNADINIDTEIDIDTDTDTDTDTEQTKKTLIIHLGMSGSLQQLAKDTLKRKHDHLILDFLNVNSNEPIQLHYHDPRRFGAVLWYDEYAEKLFNHLGPEPLEAAFNADYLYHAIHRIDNPSVGKTYIANNDRTCDSKINSQSQQGQRVNLKRAKPITRPIKSVIMDQVFVVGVGNIYATESLFLAAIHPSTPAHLLTKAQIAVLVKHIKSVLAQSIEKGGSTLRDFTVADGTTGYFQQTLNVYGKHKSPCPSCGTAIDKVVITGRASTFCPVCQPLDSI